MGSAKKHRLSNRRLGIPDYSKLNKSHKPNFKYSDVDIMAPDRLEDRRSDFMQMSYDDRLSVFMMGEHSFCVKCGNDWKLEYSDQLHTQVYICHSCGEVLSPPQSNF